MFRPVLIMPPGIEPVAVEDFKAHGVVDFANDDALIRTYIQAATAHLDGFGGILGRAIMQQTWELEMTRFQRSFVLPVPEVSSVSIHYVDNAGAEQAIDPEVIHRHATASGTRVDIAQGYRLPPPGLDHCRPLRVRFTAGYASPQEVPQPLRVAIMMLVRQFYDDRNGEGSTQGGMIDRLIAPYRWVSL